MFNAILSRLRRDGTVAKQRLIATPRIMTRFTQLFRCATKQPRRGPLKTGWMLIANHTPTLYAAFFGFNLAAQRLGSDRIERPIYRHEILRV